MSFEVMSAYLSNLNAAMIQAGKSVDVLARTLHAFSTELNETVNRSPALLRLFGKDWPKKERRRIGRKIKRLEWRRAEDV